jgi:hypothetical protein
VNLESSTSTLITRPLRTTNGPIKIMYFPFNTCCVGNLAFSCAASVFFCFYDPIISFQFSSLLYGMHLQF